MKKILLLTTIILFSITLSRAQQPSARERIQTMKIAFITEKVGLTPAEGEKFWPLYNQYWDERRKIAHRTRDIFRNVEKNSVTGRELEDYFETRDAENAVLRRWATEFKKVIGNDKVIKVFVAEESFKRFLLSQKPGQ